MMRKLSTAAAVLALSGALTLAAAPAATAAPKPKTGNGGLESIIKQMPAPLQAAADEPGNIGWDDKGPYIVLQGNMTCRIHIFNAEEWGWLFTTSPCWF